MSAILLWSIFWFCDFIVVVCDFIVVNF